MIEQEVISFIHRNAILILAGWYVFNAAVDNLPVPTKDSPAAYRWFYGFMHSVAGNLAQAGSVLKAAAARSVMADIEAKPKE